MKLLDFFFNRDHNTRFIEILFTLLVYSIPWTSYFLITEMRVKQLKVPPFIFMNLIGLIQLAYVFLFNILVEILTCREGNIVCNFIIEG